MNYPWIEEAKKHIGLKEIPGTKNSPVITGWLKVMGAWWNDDETPWCGVFTGYCMKVAKISYPKLYMRASEWANWGMRLDTPVDGCVVVFNRKGGGHVGFVMGQTKDGFLTVLGGNQGNAVTIAKFDRTRVVGYYWPKEVPVPLNKTLSIVSVTGGLSTNEA